MDLTEKDVCVVMATYNRPDDVRATLKAMFSSGNTPGKVLIMDQSEGIETMQVWTENKVRDYPVAYYHCGSPSSSKAKNLGIEVARVENFKIILILDDDVDMGEGYLKHIVKVFNCFGHIKAISGVEQNVKDSNPLLKWLFKAFSLRVSEPNSFKISGPYGICGGSVTRDVPDAEWLPGFNMAFRAEVFDDYKMPESKGYNVLEDIDSSYHVFKKYGRSSLLVTPKAKIHHRYSSVQRYPDKKRIFVNHEDHFYFYYHHFDSSPFKLAWTLTAIAVGNLLRGNINNLKAILYCLKHRNEIREGKLREFLNDDLSMKA